DFRRVAATLRARENAVDGAGLGIGFRRVGERKQIDGKQNVEVLQRIARRLAEAVVERSASRSADLIEDAVEHAAALLVLVEALIQEMKQEAAPLRHTPAEGVLGPPPRIIVRRERDEQAEPI